MSLDAILAVLQEMREFPRWYHLDGNGEAWADRIEAALTGADGAGVRRFKACEKDATCNPYIAKCGARFCDESEKTLHERRYHPARRDPEREK